MKNKIKVKQAYFKNKLKILREEYTEPDRATIIVAKGSKCEICGRRKGDAAVFGPSHYLQHKILFKVDIDVHKMMTESDTCLCVLCTACHLGYHLYNRLEPEAQFGGRTMQSVTDEIAKNQNRKLSGSLRHKVRRGY